MDQDHVEKGINLLLLFNLKKIIEISKMKTMLTFKYIE